MEIDRIFRKASATDHAIRIRISKSVSARSGSAVPLVLDQIEVHVQTIGAHHRDAAGQLLAGPVAGRHRSFLILRPDVVVIENVVSHGVSAPRSLVGGWQPNGREARLSEGAGLPGKMIPPCRGQSAIRGHWYPVVAQLVKGLQ